MFTDFLNVHYDSYHPDYAHNSVDSLRSYINLKLDHERKTPEFIADLRRKLYFIHEYNCQVAKVTHKYPRSRKLDLLLIKYVELEYDFLYHNNPRPSRQLEVACELKVLLLLQVMLYPAVLNNEPLISKNSDRALKKAVLQLLSEVRSTYLEKNKLVCNIANILLQKIHGTNRTFHFRNLIFSEVHRNLATSDYGSEDSDSEFESNSFSNQLFPPPTRVPVEKRTSSNQECVEVPVTKNGFAPIPTVEFFDDDDYFVYLKKPTKRKTQDDPKSINRKKKLISVNKQKNVFRNSQDNTVIICSDSEDEICDKNRASNRNERIKEQEKPTGVVTFEILDDDDGDDQTNYMVYIQKEVETNKKTKKTKPVEEIVICSDSEDDVTPENTTEKCVPPKVQTQENSIEISSHLENVPLIETCSEMNTEDSKDNVDETSEPQRKATSTSNEELSNKDAAIYKEINVQTSIYKEINVQTSIYKEINVQTPSTSATNFLVLDDTATTSMNAVSPNFLVHPAVTFEQVTETQLPSCEEEILTKSDDPRTVMAKSSTSDVLGGPVLSDKSDDFEDLNSVSDCRINESLLEEILLDDNYLLEGRKEFEELEYFLFNETTTEKRTFSLSNFCFDENETILQPETFDADIQSLESFLDDSQLMNFTENNRSANNLNNSATSIKKLPLDVYSRDIESLNKNLNSNASFHDTSLNGNLNQKRKNSSERKDSKSVFKQYKKNSRR